MRQAAELKSLSSVTLGQKSCEIKDLFSSHPQLMTVSLNTNGSIKLNLIVTWRYVVGRAVIVTSSRDLG